METIVRNRGTSIDASAGSHRIQSLWPPRYPTSEAIPAIALGATDSPRFLVIVSTYVEQVLTERLKTVEIYGAPGWCPSCHDGDLRRASLQVRHLREGQAEAR